MAKLEGLEILIRLGEKGKGALTPTPLQYCQQNFTSSRRAAGAQFRQHFAEKN